MAKSHSVVYQKNGADPIVSRHRIAENLELFDHLGRNHQEDRVEVPHRTKQRSDVQFIGPGAVFLPDFLQSHEVESCLLSLLTILSEAPFRIMQTPNGSKISVAMSNCGDFGWISDRRGYRYSHLDPHNGVPWPAIPSCWLTMAAKAARCSGYENFIPNACLINRYHVKSKLSLHQDRNESNLQAPIVSISLGIAANFLFGGLRRQDPCQKIRVQHGDVLVWGGPSRLAFHGIAPVGEGFHPKLGRLRINLTFRRVGRI